MYSPCVLLALILIINELSVHGSDELPVHLNDLNMDVINLSRGKRSVLLAKAVAFGKGYLIGKAAGLALKDYAYNYDESYIGYDRYYERYYNKDSYGHSPNQDKSHYAEPYSESQNQFFNTNYKTDSRVDTYKPDFQYKIVMDFQLNGQYNRGPDAPTQQAQIFRESQTDGVRYRHGYNYNNMKMAPLVENGFSISSNSPAQYFNQQFPMNSGNYRQEYHQRW